MTCSRNKVTHCTACMPRVKDPAQRFGKVVRIIHDSRDMNHLNNLFFFPVLNLEIRSVNMASTVSRLSSIDNVDVGFIVFID